MTKGRLSGIGLAVLMFFLGVVAAQAQFGKNKVQYQDFDWRFIQSEHFDVYYHQGGKYLADFTAVIAERMLFELQRDVNYSITQRIPIVVYNSHNQFQQTNTTRQFLFEGIAGFTEPLKNRIVLPFEGKWEFFRLLIRHELVHAFINDMFYGGSVQSQITNNIRVEYPLWMSEGFAEYSAVRGLDTKTDMFLRDLSISENLPELMELGGYTAYRGGQAFYWYVEDKYGRAKIGELTNRIRSIGRVNGAFESTFGMDVEEFSEQWRRDMKKIYWPDIVKYDDVEDFSTRITDHEKNRTYLNTAPAISPNGERMAFISLRDGFYSLYLMDLDTRTRRVKQLVEGSRGRDFEDLNILSPGISWDPEGRRVAISAKAGGNDALFIIDAETGEIEKYDLGFRMITSAKWSPDGTSIALVASIEETPDIFVFDIASGEVENLTEDIFTDLAPAWGPNSDVIYFVSNRADNLAPGIGADQLKMWEYDRDQKDIYSIDVNTRQMKRLTFDPTYYETSIAASPDGSSIMYVSDKSGIGNIYVMDLASGQSYPKTNSLSGIEHLSLSSDGGKLLFTSQNGGSFDIFMLRFPFDLPDKEPVLTEFRKRTLQEAGLLADSDDSAEEKPSETEKPEVSPTDSLVGYGDFNVDFSRQKAVQANPDAIADLGDDDAARPVVQVDDEFESQQYKIAFSPDLIFANAGYDTFFGVQGATQMLFSDMLGNHQIFFSANLLLNLNNSDFFLLYSYLPEQIDYNFSGFHTARFVSQDDPFELDGTAVYRFRYFGAGAGASLPFNTFDRLEAGITWLNTSTENVDYPAEPTISRMHFVPEIKFVHDDIMYGYSGPSRGTRYFLEAQGSPKFSDNQLGFVTFQADFRHYVDVGAGFTLALRGAGGASFGEDPQAFFVGGTENWINRTFSNDRLPYTTAEDLYFLTPGYPLRGWDINERNGTRMFVTNAEFRFPILLNVFFDMGGAWTDEFVASRINANGNREPRDLLMSTGLGLRLYLLGFPLKIDVAWKNNFEKFSKPVWLISLGQDF